MGILDDAADCFVQEVGAPAVAGAAGLLANGPFPKSWFELPRGVGGASDMTTRLSVLAHRHPELDARSPVFKGLLGTPSLLRTFGRAVPVVSGGMLVYDGLNLANCIVDRQP